MRTCIIPTICYGILYTGLTNSGIDLVVKTFHMMYRRILGHVPHLTQLRTSTVLETHRICHPVLTLHQLVVQAHQSLSLALTQVPIHDILHCADWTSLELTRTLLTARLVQPVPSPLSDPEAPPLVCGFCSFSTNRASEMQWFTPGLGLQTLRLTLPRTQLMVNLPVNTARRFFNRGVPSRLTEDITCVMPLSQLTLMMKKT